MWRYRLELKGPSRRPVYPTVLAASAAAGTKAPSFLRDSRIRFSGLVHSSLFKARQATWNDPSQK